MKSNNPKVAFCVINYRTPEMTLAIIQNILNLNNFKKFNSKIFVLDNGSGDNSVDFLEQNLPKDESVELFICEKNLGFAGGQDYFKGHESSSLDNINLINTDPLKDLDKTLYFYIICSNRSISENIEKSIAIGPHLSEASEWSVRKQELAYIEELKKVNQNSELLKQEIAELRRSNSSREEMLDDILKSKKYKAVTKIAKLNKALKNPKIFINKIKDVTHRK